MDKMLIDKDHITLYLSTFQIGLGINYVPQNKTIVIHLLLLELHINWLKG